MTILIPSVDRGRTDPQNTIGFGTDISDNEIYTIVVKSGPLNSKYPHNQLGLCAASLYTTDDISTKIVTTIWTTVQQNPTVVDKIPEMQLYWYKCRCFRTRLMFNSRCHSSLSGYNKKPYCYRYTFEDATSMSIQVIHYTFVIHVYNEFISIPYNVVPFHIICQNCERNFQLLRIIPENSRYYVR